MSLRDIDPSLPRSQFRTAFLNLPDCSLTLARPRLTQPAYLLAFLSFSFEFNCPIFLRIVCNFIFTYFCDYFLFNYSDYVHTYNM